MCEVVVVGGGPAVVMAAPREGAWVRCCPCRVRADGRHLYERWLVPTRVLVHAAWLVRDAEQFADYGTVGETPWWTS